MGKVTHYHPVSLTVLRAAVIYCGYRFGKIQQTEVNTAEQTATYKAHITEQPRGRPDYNPSSIKAGLQECFAADVTIENVWYTARQNKWMCSFSVRLRQTETVQEDTEQLHWLIDNDTEVGARDLYGREVGVGEFPIDVGEYDGLPF